MITEKKKSLNNMYHHTYLQQFVTKKIIKSYVSLYISTMVHKKINS